VCPGKSNPITLRDGEYWPAELFKELYHLRCGETKRTTVSSWLPLTDHPHVSHLLSETPSFSGRPSHTIYQDFHVKVLSKNLTTAFAFSAQDLAEQRFAHRKRLYQCNFTQVISKMKGSIVQLLSQPDPVPCIRALIDIFSITVEAVRPGRHYARKTSSSLCRRYHASYKHTR
jgi:hypothetical protein